MAKAEKKPTPPDKLGKLRRVLRALDPETVRMLQHFQDQALRFDPETLRMLKHSQDQIESLKSTDKAVKSVDKAIMAVLRSARDRPADVPKTQPDTARNRPTQLDTKTRVADEARRLKAAGEIREGMRITHFAKLLERRMREAAETDTSVRRVSWGYIKNNLPAWGLWPISQI
jgi:hypothetical protein